MHGTTDGGSLSLPLTELDQARAQYVWRLHRDKPELNDQIKDLAKVFGTLMAAERPRRAHAPVLQDGSAPFVRLGAHSAPPADTGGDVRSPDQRNGVGVGHGSSAA